MAEGEIVNTEVNTEATPPSDDIRSLLEKGFADADKQSDGGAEVSVANEGDKDAQSGERKLRNPNRDDSGKFTTAPKESKAKTNSETPIESNTEAAPLKAAPVKETTAPESKPTAQETPSTAPSNAPPVSWAADAKAEWSKLTPAIQNAVLKREHEASTGIRQYSEQTRRLESALSPIAQAAKEVGIPVDEAAQRLVHAHNLLRQNGPAGILALCQQFGVDPSTLAAHQPAIAPQIQPQVYRDPRVDELYDWRQNQLADMARSSENFVETFASTEGHEHFDAVSNEIMALIPVIKGSNPHWSQQQVLQDAYDRAVYANPSTRKALQESQRVKDEAERLAASKAKVSNARSAAVSISGAPVGTQATPPKGSVREELEAAFAGVSGR